jgi:hypothetical protein
MTKDERAEWVRRGYGDPVRAYSCQRSAAKLRRIAFDLSFEQWWRIWEPHYTNRGCGSDQLVHV